MQKHILYSNRNKDFIIILHACPSNTHACPDNILACPNNADGSFQWYITDCPNRENAREIEGQSYESFTLSTETIAECYKDKWLYCKRTLPDCDDNEGYVYLSEDLIEMISKNQFDTIEFFDETGNIREDVGYKG